MLTVIAFEKRIVVCCWYFASNINTSTSSTKSRLLWCGFSCVQIQFEWIKNKMSAHQIHNIRISTSIESHSLARCCCCVTTDRTGSSTNSTIQYPRRLCCFSSCFSKLFMQQLVHQLIRSEFNPQLRNRFKCEQNVVRNTTRTIENFIPNGSVRISCCCWSCLQLLKGNAQENPIKTENKEVKKTHVARRSPSTAFVSLRVCEYTTEARAPVKTTASVTHRLTSNCPNGFLQFILLLFSSAAPIVRIVVEQHPTRPVFSSSAAVEIQTMRLQQVNETYTFVYFFVFHRKDGLFSESVCCFNKAD